MPIPDEFTGYEVVSEALVQSSAVAVDAPSGMFIAWFFVTNSSGQIAPSGSSAPNYVAVPTFDGSGRVTSVSATAWNINMTAYAVCVAP